MNIPPCCRIVFTLVLFAGCDASTSAEPVGPSFADRLRAFPGVSSVAVQVAADNPRCRIVHIKDRQAVAQDVFATALRKLDESMTDDEIDRQYDMLLDELEAVQREQKELLRTLCREFGVRTACCEALPGTDMAAWRTKMERLRKTDLGKLQQQLERMSEIVARLNPKSEDAQDAGKIKSGVENSIRRYRYERLLIGAVGQLLMSGELDDALPIDSESGAVATIGALQKQGPLNLVVLEGGPDLSNQVRALPNKRVEYVTITTLRAEFHAAPSGRP